MIVVLSGPVGAGKTTVARELVTLTPAPVAYIEGDKFWYFIAKQKANKDRSEAFRMVMRAMFASARHFDRDGYHVILDFSVPPWFLEGAKKLLVGEPFDFVALRPSLEVCAERAASREEGRIDDYEMYRELYRSFDAAKHSILDPGESDAAAIAQQIRTGLDSGAYRIE